MAFDRRTTTSAWAGAWDRMRMRRNTRGALREHRTTFLYVIWNGADRVKVGISVDVTRRLGQLQGSTAETLAIYAAVPLDTSRPLMAERAAHDELRPYRLRGEWFACHPERALATIHRIAFMAEDGASFSDT